MFGSSRVVLAALPAVVMLAACSSDNSSSTMTPSGPTTATTAPMAPPSSSGTSTDPHELRRCQIAPCEQYGDRCGQKRRDLLRVVRPLGSDPLRAGRSPRYWNVANPTRWQRVLADDTASGQGRAMLFALSKRQCSDLRSAGRYNRRQFLCAGRQPP